MAKIDQKRVVFESRSIVLKGRNTTIALERPYWRMLEVIAETTDTDWRNIVVKLLAIKPAQLKSRAAFLRTLAIKLLIKSMSPEVHDRIFKDS
jgi:predicted DNA-binding ribbon-helix-helix protein